MTEQPELQPESRPDSQPESLALRMMGLLGGRADVEGGDFRAEGETSVSTPRNVAEWEILP